MDNNKKDINVIIAELKNDFKYLKLKSANIEKDTSSYIFWYEMTDNDTNMILNKFSKISDENLNFSIYSKSGVFE